MKDTAGIFTMSEQIWELNSGVLLASHLCSNNYGPWHLLPITITNPQKERKKKKRTEKEASLKS